MLSFRRFLLEYDVDPSIRTRNLPSSKGLQGPSISDELDKHLTTLWVHLAGIGPPEFLEELKYKRGQDVKHPRDMSTDELIKHVDVAKKYVPERYHEEIQNALNKVILHDPMANIELQNMGGVKGTGKERKEGPARNLQRQRRADKRRPTS